MKNKLMAVLLSTGLASGAQAQLTWVKGFVVSNEGDTLRGQIQSNTPAVTSTKMVFQSETVEKIVHKPFQIKSWGSEDGTVYDSKTYKMGSKDYGVFMRRLTTAGDEVQLYEYWNTDGTNGFTMLFLEKQQEITTVEMGKFKKQMSEYFSDNEAIKNGINENKYKKNYDGLLQVVKEYNESKKAKWD